MTNDSEGAGREPVTDKDARIKVCKGGPYIVTGNVPLIQETADRGTDGIPDHWSEMGKHPREERYSLCRCGGTGNAPYCDRTHVALRFDGTESASREPYLEHVKRFEGPTLDMTDRLDICAKAQFCRRGEGTWKSVQGSADPDKRRLAIESAGQCPAGRLVVYEKDGSPIEPPFEKAISVTQDPGRKVSGPLWVKGRIPVESADGFTYEVRNRVTLCRCGGSGIKPLCDGSHIRMGFKDRAEAP